MLPYPAFTIKAEKKQSNSLHFLDISMEKEDTEFVTSFYRKPIFTGQYIRWNSFTQKPEKLAFWKRGL